MTCLFLSNVILLYSAIKRKLFWEKGEANVRSHGKKSRVFKASEEHFQCFLSQIWIKLQSFLSVQRTKKYDEVKYCSVMIFGERPRRLTPPPPNPSFEFIDAKPLVQKLRQSDTFVWGWSVHLEHIELKTGLKRCVFFSYFNFYIQYLRRSVFAGFLLIINWAQFWFRCIWMQTWQRSLKN